jgi:3-hydroxyacyl-[acyl-carrier-protein] dehydratase
MIKNEIEKLLKNFNEDSENGVISANFAFPKSFAGFQGHFPEEAILPGICQIEAVMALLSVHLKKEIKISSLSRAKYLNVVKPEEEITVSGTYSDSGNFISGKFKITKQIKNETVNVSRISIKVV